MSGLFRLCAVMLVSLVWGSAVWAAESGRLVEKDGKYVFVESMDPATKLLLERAVKQGTITQEEFSRVAQESERRAYLLQPSYRLWYDRGFNISLNDNAFLLKIRARFMARMTNRFRNDAWRNPGDAKNFPELLGVFGDYRAGRSDNESTQFNLRRARLYFMGHLFNPDFKYYIQLRGETAENAQSPGSLQLFDWFFTSTHMPALNVQFGQYKAYFTRAQINSTASMQFAERALVMDAFTASGLDRRDIGLTLMNDEELYPVNYYLGVFNGAGPNFNRLGSFTSEQPTQGCPAGVTVSSCEVGQRNINANVRMDLNKLMLAGRLMWNIMGRAGYGEGDLVYSETPQMAIAGGYAYNPSINTSSNNAFIGIDLGNLNYRRQLAAFGNGRQLGWGVVDYSTWSLDYALKYRGFSFQSEYYFKNVTRHNKGVPCMNDSCTSVASGLLGNAQGWYGQSGYFLVPRKLELAARYAYWDPDTNAAGDIVKEANVALTYYVNGNYDQTITLQYSNFAMGTGGYAIGRSAPLPAASGTVPLDAVGGTLIENAIRLQYQIFF
ncbi:MAG: hypothetical protein JW388_0215 [Nitrospira sp.]|nr:hypothetical protein [Nitrospira sp.]